jgi:hypothetical protein
MSIGKSGVCINILGRIEVQDVEGAISTTVKSSPRRRRSSFFGRLVSGFARPEFFVEIEVVAAGPDAQRD